MSSQPIDTGALPKITLIECWFGPFPPWIYLYLKSCEHNPDVRWVILHDSPRPQEPPHNVEFVRLTKADLEARLTRHFQQSIRVSPGAKVCDVRPAFGVVFADYLKDAEFWGYNDSDLFWGRIRDFLSAETLNAYDIVTACRTSICGQFTIFRNSGITRKVYEVIPDYVAKLAAPSMFYLDEHVLDEGAQKRRLRILRRQLQVHDIGSVEWEEKAKALELAEKGHLNEWFWEGGPCRWEDGIITHVESGKQAMFFHFKSWKSDWRRRGRVPVLPYSAGMRGFEVTAQGIKPLFASGRVRQRWAYECRHVAPNATRVLALRCSEEAKRVVRGIKRRLA